MNTLPIPAADLLRYLTRRAAEYHDHAYIAIAGEVIRCSSATSRPCIGTAGEAERLVADIAIARAGGGYRVREGRLIGGWY